MFFFCQPKEMLVSFGWDPLLRIHSFVKKYKHEIWANWGSQKMAWAEVNTRYLSFFRLCQLLLAIHLRLQ